MKCVKLRIQRYRRDDPTDYPFIVTLNIVFICQDRTGQDCHHKYTSLDHTADTTQTPTIKTNKISFSGVIITFHLPLFWLRGSKPRSDLAWKLDLWQERNKRMNGGLVLLTALTSHHHLVSSNKPTNLAGELPAQQKTHWGFWAVLPHYRPALLLYSN